MLPKMMWYSSRLLSKAKAKGHLRVSPLVSEVKYPMKQTVGCCPQIWAFKVGEKQTDHLLNHDVKIFKFWKLMWIGTPKV